MAGVVVNDVDLDDDGFLSKLSRFSVIVSKDISYIVQLMKDRTLVRKKLCIIFSHIGQCMVSDSNEVEKLPLI